VVTVDLTREQSPQLVPVPNLLNMSEDEARRAVARVQLTLNIGTGGGDVLGAARRVIRQRPVAGQLVPAGTAVSVDLATDAANPRNWWLAGLMAVGLVAAGGIGIRLRSRRRYPRTAPPLHVDATGRPLTAANIRLNESGPTWRIRAEARLDRGQQHMKEEKR
jgi:hypothetical protein